MVDALVCWIKWAAQSTVSYAVDALEFVLNVLATAVNLALSLLPTFAIPPVSVDSGIVGFLNYVLPVSTLFYEFSVLIAAWIVYRIYQWVLAWGKVDY